MTTISKNPNINLALFYKAQIRIWHLFHEAQIIIWQLFFLSPNIILATISQSPKYYFGKRNNYFLLKAQILFWHMLTKLKYYLWHLLNLSLMGNIIIHPSRNIFLTRFIKAHVHYPWQNYSSCKVNQAQASLSAKPSKVRPTHTQISSSGDHVN